jgi:hypothetical protein
MCASDILGHQTANNLLVTTEAKHFLTWLGGQDERGTLVKKGTVLALGVHGFVQYDASKVLE